MRIHSTQRNAHACNVCLETNRRRKSVRLIINPEKWGKRKLNHSNFTSDSYTDNDGITTKPNFVKTNVEETYDDRLKYDVCPKAYPTKASLHRHEKLKNHTGTVDLKDDEAANSLKWSNQNLRSTVFTLR